MQTALSTATTLFNLGYQPVPIPVGAKAPTMNNWQKFKTTEAELSKYFNGRPQNIGVLLGKPSKFLIDIDLDTPEARRAAPYFLPKTATFGRASNPVSHYLYLCEISTKKFQDPLKVSSKSQRKEAMLVEIRSTGLQTVFPGSTHPSGEAIEWPNNVPGTPLEISSGDLSKAVGKTAAAGLLASYWRDGIRNELAMALAGALIRHGFDDAAVLHFVKAICVASGDDETEMRLGSARATIARFKSNEPTTGMPKLIELTDKKIVDAFCKWLEIKPNDSANSTQTDNAKASNDDAPEETEKKSRKTQATVLLELSEELSFFHTPNEECFAVVPVNEHRENLKLNTKAFRSWLARKHYEAEGQAPSAQSLQDVITTLSGKALFDSPCFETHIRVGENDGAIFIDLCNPEWQAVKITSEGWQIVESEEVPVKFRRSRGMLPLPMPESDGNLDLLRPFINVIDEDFILVLAWLVCALRPSKPFAMVALHGQQGSAKSTTSRILRAVIDPNTADLRSSPRDGRDLMIAANNSWIVAFDNLSRAISESSADDICRLATGGGFSTRELYSDSDEIIFDAKRPVIFNGIEELATRPDLVERCVSINAPRIDTKNRKTEAELWTEFEAVKPKIVGALFSKVSETLKALPTVEKIELPRMADFGEFAFAAFGSPFINRYKVVCGSANEAALEASPTAPAILQFMATRNEWEGTAGDLLKEFEKFIDEKELKRKEFPKTPLALSNRLKRDAANLRAAGINYEHEKREPGTGRRLTTLTKIEQGGFQASQASQASQANKDGHEKCDDTQTRVVTDKERVVTDEPKTYECPNADCRANIPFDEKECPSCQKAAYNF